MIVLARFSYYVQHESPYQQKYTIIMVYGNFTHQNSDISSMHQLMITERNLGFNTIHGQK